ncbi:MAG TPA: hypothetical protein VGE45_01105 [Chloroflexia bacterium]|jgi:hypothetical protein
MFYKNVCVIAKAHQGCVENIAAYTSWGALQKAEFPGIVSELGDLLPEDFELSGDFDADWKVLCEAMSESESSWDIRECILDDKGSGGPVI